MAQQGQAVVSALSKGLEAARRRVARDGRLSGAGRAYAEAGNHRLKGRDALAAAPERAAADLEAADALWLAPARAATPAPAPAR